MSNVQYSGQGRERLVQAASATADANGMITLRLGPCPLGFVWQGSVTITNAPSGALLTASVASTPWGQWAGPTNFGPVQLWGNETLVVVGVGLQKNTQYAMQFFGVAMPEHLAEPLPPVAPLSTVAVETTTLLVNGSATALTVVPTNLFHFTPPTLTRRLTVLLDTAGGFQPASLSIVGDQTGTIYWAMSYTASDNRAPHYVSIEPAADSTYSFRGNAAGAATYLVWILASATNPLIWTEPNHPLFVVPGQAQGQAFPALFNSSGSPVGPFTRNASAVLGTVFILKLIEAPGVTQCIYVQTISASNAAIAAGGNIATFKESVSASIFGELCITAANNSLNQTFPGGFEMPVNAALVMDIVTAQRVTVTYVVGLPT